jgi:hypothetical protein
VDRRPSVGPGEQCYGTTSVVDVGDVTYLGGSVELTFSATDDELALGPFYDWLRADVDVLRSTTISIGGSGAAGHMGAFEVVTVSIGSLTGLANLGIAYANFLRSRKDKPAFTINVVGELTAEQLAMIRTLELPVAREQADEA